MLRITERWNRGVPIVAVEVDLLAENGSEVHAAVMKLMRNGERNIILDLAMIRRMSSAGVGNIIRCYQDAQLAMCRLKFLHPGRRIRTLLAQAKLTMILDETFDDENEAVQSFTRTP